MPSARAWACAQTGHRTEVGGHKVSKEKPWMLVGFVLFRFLLGALVDWGLPGTYGAPSQKKWFTHSLASQMRFGIWIMCLLTNCMTHFFEGGDVEALLASICIALQCQASPSNVRPCPSLDHFGHLEICSWLCVDIYSRIKRVHTLSEFVFKTSTS